MSSKKKNKARRNGQLGMLSLKEAPTNVLYSIGYSLSQDLCILLRILAPTDFPLHSCIDCDCQCGLTGLRHLNHSILLTSSSVPQMLIRNVIPHQSLIQCPYYLISKIYFSMTQKNLSRFLYIVRDSDRVRKITPPLKNSNILEFNFVPLCDGTTWHHSITNCRLQEEIRKREQR